MKTLRIGGPALLLLFLAACGGEDPTGLTATPSAPATPSPPASSPPAASGLPASTSPAPSRQVAKPPASGGSSRGGSASAILRGERQVVILPVDSFESVLALNDADRLTLLDGDPDRDLFVLAPVGGGRFQIKTAKADRGGEPSCMQVKEDGVNPATVVARACDVGVQNQLFTIEEAKQVKNGRPSYNIMVDGGAYLLEGSSGGLIAEQLGDGSPTSFTFVDNGPSALPKLGD
ncbi:hypothetical protein [Phytohabitans flavus]|nr:hypothetical protein [Phytohabitans flavus]